MQERDLVGEYLLAHRISVEIEVVARVTTQFPRGARSAICRVSSSGVSLSRSATHTSTGISSRCASSPGRYRNMPKSARGATSLRHSESRVSPDSIGYVLLGARGGGDGHLARLAHHGNVVGREAHPAAYRIDGHRPDELEGVQRRAALHPARKAVERDLGDHRSDARIFGGDDDVPTAERGAPQRDPIGIHAFEAASAANRRAPVLELALDADQLARLATALAEAAVVERECREAGLGEPPRVVE